MNPSTCAAEPVIQKAKRLNLGVGEEKEAGYINVDWQFLTNADITHNLTQFPYPFADARLTKCGPFILLHTLIALRCTVRIIPYSPYQGTSFLAWFYSCRAHSWIRHYISTLFQLFFTKSGYYGINFRLELLRLGWLSFPHLMEYLGYSKVTLSALNGVNAAFVSCQPGTSLRQPNLVFWVGGFDEIEMRFICIK